MSRYPKGYRKGDDATTVIGAHIDVAEAIRDVGEGKVPPGMRGVNRPSETATTACHRTATLSRDYVVLRDANGKLTPFNVGTFMDELGVKSELFGMPFSAILELRKVYLEAGGKEPMTAASVREVLG